MLTKQQIVDQLEEIMNYAEDTATQNKLMSLMNTLKREIYHETGNVPR